MILWLSLRWWYGQGFHWVWHKALVYRLDSWLAYFSVASLVRTLFAPYKQTFASGGSGSIGVMFRSWVDSTISRFVGLFIRSTLILAWLVCSFFVLVSGVIGVVLWPLIPIFPFISIVVLAVRG